MNKNRQKKACLLSAFMVFGAMAAYAQNGPGGVPAAVWYRADKSADITLSGNKITSWSDFLGSANDLGQATAANQPLYSNGDTIANFNPTVTFYGNQWLNTTGVTSASPIIDRDSGAIFIAGRMGATVSAAGLAGFDASMNYPGLHTSNGNNRKQLLFFTAGGPGYQGVSPADPLDPTSKNIFEPNTPFLGGAGWKNSVATYLDATVSMLGDTVNYPSASNKIYNVNMATTAENFYVGGDSDYGKLTGQVNEVVVFDHKLTAAEMDKVESYMAIKYGISYMHGEKDYVSSAGTTVWDVSDNSGNDYNIAGIARDDNGALSQKQSWCTNGTGQQVLISTTGLANTNAANSGTLTNNQYLIWGDNGMAKYPSVVVNNIAGTNYRFASVWKVQNTGSVGTVRVAWPQNTALGAIKLVQSTDSTFATGNAVTDMTGNTQVVNGVTYNYADVTLADGQYFTFAAFVQAPGGVAIPTVWLKADAGFDTSVGHINQWQNFGLSGGFAEQIQSGATTYDAPYYKQNIHNFNPSLVDSVTNANGGLELMDVFPTYEQRALSTFVLQDQPDVTQQRSMVSFVNQDNFAASGDLPWFASQSATQLYFWWDGSYQTAPALPNSLKRYNNIPTINSYHKSIYTAYPDTTFLGMNGAGLMYAIGSSNTSIGIGQHLLINADGGNNNTSGGNISEVIVFDRDLTAAERLRVNSYLALKYGITLYNDSATNATNYLSSASQTVWDTTINEHYNNNIAGIAYDNNSGLNQKQSKSVNSGKQVLIATTGLSNTNEANATALTDGQYLIWGDNGLARKPSVAIAGAPGVNFRFASTWKVQNTGSVGTVRVTWPQNTAWGTIKLVQSADSAFGSGNTVTDMTGNTQVVNGVTYNYADVTLADGQYFTFAVKAYAPGGIATLPAVWYRPDMVSDSTWKDASINSLDLTNQSTTGDTMVMAGDQAHNFNSWTTDYSNANYYNYLDPNAANTDLEVNPVFGNYNVNSYSYMPISIFGVARPTASVVGIITGIDNELSNGAEPGLTVYPQSGGVSPRFYRFSYGGIDKTAISKVNGLNETGVYYAHPYPGDGTATGTGDLVLGLNGSDTTIAGTNPVSSVAGPYLKIGYSAFGFSQFQGDIQEVIWYKASLTEAEKYKVETYLALKFGSTLAHNYVDAAGDTVYSITVADSAYRYNIAGIGREENNGNLDQRQSNSVNTGKQLIVATTGLANTNDANATSLTEGQYLVWGDNGLAKAPSIYTANTFSNVNVRFAAIWRVQNTGNVGTVRVAWPAGLNNLALIQSADTTFNASDVLTPMAQSQTINGVEYNYADVTLANGQYFTLAAKIEHAPGGVFNGLAQWFRADKQTTIGTNDTLTSWTDYAMNIEASRISTAALPLLHTGDATYLNFNPGVNFTANNQKLGNITIQALGSRNYDIFSATKEGMAGTRYYNIGMDNTTLNGNNWDSPGLYADGSVASRDSNFASLGFILGGGSPALSAYMPNVFYYSFTDVSGAKKMNGASTGSNATFTNRGLPKGGFIFGNNSGAGTFGDDAGFIGNIGDLVVYNTNLTANERNRVDAYLAIKYGITLDTASSYLTSASTVVWDKDADNAFYHNVAGIGRDDVSDLYQKQSRSQIINNVDSQVTIAVDSIYVTNVANPGAISDQQFLLWGDNGNTQAMTNTASTYTTFAFNGSSDNRRMNRVWKVRNTDVANQVAIRFPQASVGTTTIPGETAAAGYAIIFASDSAITTGITVLPLTGNGTNYDVTTTFPDGVSYFTFGKIMDTALPPATCTPDIYLAQDDPTTLRNVDVSTNPFVYTIVGAASPGTAYNAIGVNPKDGYVYGMLNNSRTLIRINPENGNLTTLGTITGLPTGTSFNSGEIDSAGNYYVKALGSTNTLYKVDVNTMAVTTINMSASITVSDIAYNVTDQLIYTVNSNGRLYTIDPVSGTTTAIGVSSGSAVLGAMYGSGDGNIYGVDNSGGFYQFNKTTGQKVLLSSSPSSGNNDGARCVNAILTLPSDLYVTKTTTNTNYTPGDTVVYTVVAGNNGPFGVMNAILRDSVPAGIPDSNVSYTAVASSGSSTTVSGTMMGNIADTFSIPKNGTITYTVSIVIPAGFTGNLVNTASVVAPDNINDTTVGNNATTVTLGSSLPVTLLDFNAEKVNHEVQLSWMTTNELNSKGFEVERSTDATDWKAIGFVASKADNGNSKLQLSYLFNDIHPESNKNFYRLKEVDINGNYSYSEIRMVNFTDGSSIQIHPNPVLENVTISGLTGNRQIVVTNVLGQVVLRAQTNGEATKELHTAALTPGTYFITISNGQNEKVTFKMIKE